MKKSITEALTYLFVGSVGTGAHYLVLVIGMQVYNAPLVFSSLGFIVGALVNHHFNRKYTFSTDKTYLRTLFESLTVASIMFVVNLLCMFMLVRIYEINYLISQVLTTGITFLLGFFLNKYIVFIRSGE